MTPIHQVALHLSKNPFTSYDIVNLVQGGMCEWKTVMTRREVYDLLQHQFHHSRSWGSVNTSSEKLRMRRKKFT